MAILSLDHLEQLLEYRSKTVKYHLLSATKQRRVNDLISVGCLQFGDDNDTVWITQLGIHTIDSAFAEWLGEVKACQPTPL